MFRQFLPSEFKSPPEFPSPSDFLPYRLQLKMALKEKEIRQLIDIHLYRWQECDTADIQQALVMLQAFIDQKDQEIQELETANSSRNLLDGALSSKKIAEFALKTHREEWRRPLLEQEQCIRFLGRRQACVEAATYFRRTLPDIRHETLFLACRLFTVFPDQEASLFLACMFKEDSYDDDVYDLIRENGNCRGQVTNNWKKVQPLLVGNISVLMAPTVYDFLETYELQELELTALFFLEIAYFGEGTELGERTERFGAKPSLIAKACVFLAHMQNKQSYPATPLVREHAAIIIQRAGNVLTECDDYFSSYYEQIPGFSKKILELKPERLNLAKRMKKNSVKNRPKTAIRRIQRIQRIQRRRGSNKRVRLQQSSLKSEDVLGIGDVLGSGQYGTVTLGTYNQQPVAIKTMTRESFVETGDLYRAVREIAILDVLGQQHQLVVHFLNYTFEANITIVLEVAQGDLESLLTNGDISNWPQEQVFNACQQIVKGVAYCHDYSIMHRDLKPGNILVFPDGKGWYRFKITDFGLSRPFSRSKRAYTMGVVTRWWRAPEISLGAYYYDASIDAWSTGVILSQLVSKANLNVFQSYWEQDKTFLRSIGCENEEDSHFLKLCQTFGFPSDQSWAMGRAGNLEDDFKYRRMLEIWQKWPNAGNEASGLLFAYNCFSKAKTIAPQLEDVIRRLLVMNPAHRITMREATVVMRQAKFEKKQSSKK